MSGTGMAGVDPGIALAQLARVRPGYDLFFGLRGEYVARSKRGADMHPWAVVTEDLAELAKATSPQDAAYLAEGDLAGGGMPP